jgi:hypothetical protein
VTGVITAKYHGGGMTPKFGVLHDAETPLTAGYARSIANYFTRNTNETSAHFMVDPVDTIEMLDTGLVAWHCGNGNTRSIGVEQAGYASFNTGQWTTSDGQRQIQRVAALMRDIHAVHGIGLYWMSDQQIRDAHAGRIVGGWTTHHRCSIVLGGSSHSDPDPSYPYATLMSVANGGAPTPAPPSPPPSGNPPVAPWVLPAGHWLGNVAGGVKQHGGDLRYDSQAVHEMVQTAQRYLILHGCVPGQSDWHSGWADGVWGPQTDGPMATWHARFYPGQQYPSQCWSDDYARLTRP